MRRGLLALLLLVLAACGPSPAPSSSPSPAAPSPAASSAAPVASRLATPPPGPAEHLVLVDVSGSMRTGGFGTPKGFSPTFQGFIRALLAADGTFFHAEDPVTFRPFADERTEVAEGRTPVGPFPLAQAQATFAGMPGPGGGATDLERVLTDLAGQRRPEQPVRFVWLFTDNENNLGAKRSDREFYRLLRDGGDYDRVYFFPMARPAGQGGQDRGGALVLYLLVDAAEPVAPWIEGFVDEVERRLGFEGVLFRPLYTDLDLPVLRVGREVEVADERGRFLRALLSDDRYILNLHRKGTSWEGRMRFRLRSRMEGWKIQKARVSARLESEDPAVRDVVQDLSPRRLDVQPGRDSDQEYTIHVRASGPLKEKGTAPADLFLDTRIELAREGPSPNLQPAVSDEVLQRMAAVPGLPEILGFMQHQADGAGAEEESRTIEIRQPLLLRTATASGPGWWLLLLGLLLLALLVAWVLSGRSYRLATATEERRVRLGGVFRRVDLESEAGELLGRLEPAGRGVRVVPEPEVRVDGQEAPLEVDPEHGEVRFGLQGRRGGPTVFTLSRPGAGGGGAGEGEGLSL